MEHLTVDEMIEFVSLTELTPEATRLCSDVNNHICKCDRCLNLVRSFQMIYDEFTALGLNENFKGYVIKKTHPEDMDKTELDR